MRKKTTLALILMMNLACAMAQKSGTTGPLSWNYNETSKELTITGNGAMPNYDYGAAPWQEYQEGIETVNVGSGVTSIGSNAFCNCIYMTTLSLPAGMETIGDNAFSYCLSITSAELPGTITKIGESAFEGCTSLESIALPEELETIGGFAFADCVALASVDFPSYLTYIGRWSFSGCEALGEVSIPASVETISDNAFASCVNLSSVQLSEGLKSIEETAFNACEQLQAITIPSTVTNIGGGIFADCKKLSAIDMAEGNTAYVSVEGVLYNKAMTTLVQYPAGKDNDSYTIPESVTTVGDYAFCGNDYLTSLPLHDKLKVISDFAFARVSGVPTFDVPAGTESIGESAFHDCWSLTDINVAKSNPNYTSVDGVLYDKEMNTLMQYPEGKTTPEYIAPKSLRNLGPYAFFGNKKLTTVDLPDGVASIGDFAFGWCQNLSSLTVRVADPATIELGLIPFFRGANAVDCTLRVPVGSKTKYENADLWKDFAPNIEELTSDGIDSATADGQQADKAERVYSRDGVQLRGTLGQQQKGVYIVGGKKVVKR